MKKSLMIMLFISIILCITATCVFAETVPVSLEGETSVTPGSTGTVNVKISSSDTIGVVSGVIGYDSNITSVEVSGKNNWVVTYNSETGQFNAYKAEGAKLEEIIQIKYTVSNTEGTGTITLSSLQVTNINYETENVSDITKDITIKNSTTDDPVDDPSDKPTDKPTDDPSDKPTDAPSDKPSDKPTDDPSDEPANKPADDPAEKPTDNNEKKNTNSGISNGTNGATTSKTDTITSAKTLPYAGIMTKVVLPISIVLVGIISVGAYMELRKYRGIK